MGIAFNVRSAPRHVMAPSISTLHSVRTERLYDWLPLAVDTAVFVVSISQVSP